MLPDIDHIIRLYRTSGKARHGTEAISQEQHALQCAALAEAAGAPPALVAAALLHDVGHLLQAQGMQGEHEDIGAQALGRLFPAAVVAPLRLHVGAKRFLCVTEPGYWVGLSQDSRRSLVRQGGPFTAEQATLFARQPWALDAIDLRRWDELARSPTRITPGWDHFAPLLESLALHRAALA